MQLKSSFAVLSVLLLHLCQGAPSSAERRVSRDLDKIDGLRARLLRLQKQIRDLEASEKAQPSGAADGREGEKNDVSAEVDVSKLHQMASEDRMTSSRQRDVQTLAQRLDGYNKDLHELAGALSQLMRENEKDSSDVNRENSAGEYLGDRYSVADKKDSPSVEEEDDERLKIIYNMLLQLYNQQNDQDIILDTRGSAASRRQPTEYVSTAGRPVHIDEGSFGEFFDEDAAQRSELAQASANQITKEVLNAVEVKLLKDLELAQHAGLSVDDIIHDLQAKGEEERQRELQRIEQQLGELQRLQAQ